MSIQPFHHDRQIWCARSSRFIAFINTECCSFFNSAQTPQSSHSCWYLSSLFPQSKLSPFFFFLFFPFLFLLLDRCHGLWSHPFFLCFPLLFLISVLHTMCPFLSPSKGRRRWRHQTVWALQGHHPDARDRKEFVFIFSFVFNFFSSCCLIWLYCWSTEPKEDIFEVVHFLTVQEANMGPTEKELFRARKSLFPFLTLLSLETDLLPHSQEEQLDRLQTHCCDRFRLRKHGIELFFSVQFTRQLHKRRSRGSRGIRSFRGCRVGCRKRTKSSPRKAGKATTRKRKERGDRATANQVSPSWSQFFAQERTKAQRACCAPSQSQKGQEDCKSSCPQKVRKPMGWSQRRQGRTSWPFFFFVWEWWWRWRWRWPKIPFFSEKIVTSSCHDRKERQRQTFHQLIFFFVASSCPCSSASHDATKVDDADPFATRTEKYVSFFFVSFFSRCWPFWQSEGRWKNTDHEEGQGGAGKEDQRRRKEKVWKEILSSFSKPQQKSPTSIKTQRQK